MPTLTYRHERSDLGQITQDVRLFRYRLMRQSWWPSDDTRWPYLWVPERGKQGTNRLHTHFACEWWERLGCVEVCQRCATKALREKRPDLAGDGAHCVGCVWGHGFVGAPREGTGDPAALARYVSGYVGKDLGELVEAGQQPYRVAEGFQPQSERRLVATLAEAGRAVAEGLGVEQSALSSVALHQTVQGWEAPPTWAVQMKREEAL
jgi:hypothetical protein